MARAPSPSASSLRASPAPGTSQTTYARSVRQASSVFLVRDRAETEAERDATAVPDLDARARDPDPTTSDPDPTTSDLDLTTPVSDPFEDADALDELGDRIATLAAHIHAATHQMLVLIADFDRRRGWEIGGHRSCAHWLQVRTGMDLGTAREKVRTARVLVGLPETSASMARGQLSFSQVRALTRVATPENESDLLELAQGCTTADLERTVRAWKIAGREDEIEMERQRRLARTFSIFPGDDGLYVVTGRLAPEVGALLMRAVEAASDTIYREKRPPWEREQSRQDAARRRADAVGLIAERALAAGFGPRSKARSGPRSGASGEEGGRDGGPRDGDIGANGDAGGAESHLEAGSEDPTGAGAENPAGAGSENGTGAAAENLTGARAESPTGAESQNPTGARSETGSLHASVPISGTTAERYQVVLHLEPDTLDAQAEPGMSELDDGVRVSAETARRLACDCSLVLMSHDTDGSPLDVGRKTRTIPPALRRALDARDRGCRFPDHSPPASGARNARLSHGHHVRHWADGGETSLANCVLLCGYHHYLVHEGGWTMEWWGMGRPVFHSPRGDSFFDGGWEPPEVGEDAARELVHQNRLRGVEPDGSTAGALWKSRSLIPESVRLRGLM